MNNASLSLPSRTYMQTILISEIFASIQGEGALAGTPSIFVRTSLCNLRCSWCDTPYTSWQPEFSTMSGRNIVDKVTLLASSVEPRIVHVVITGGEPLLQFKNLASLCGELSNLGFHLTIETNGTLFFPLEANLVSISPKLTNSTPIGNYLDIHERTRLRIDELRKFTSHYAPPAGSFQLKFVIESPNDLAEVKSLIDIIHIPSSKVFLMPQARNKDELRERGLWLRALCEKHGFIYGQRLHIELFGNRRGT